ncbi:MAG: ABC transporter permease [Deinococcota bacterium]
MTQLLRLEAQKLWHLTSLRFSLVLFIVFPLLWAYAPGIFNVYGFFVVSGFQVPGLVLRSSMEFLLPLLVAIASAELFGLEINYGTLRTILLRPVSRGQWLTAKALLCCFYPFVLVYMLLALSLLAGVFAGYGPFQGGTGVGASGLVGFGTMLPGDAFVELVRAYTIAACSLIPIGLLALLGSVLLMRAGAGALAALAALIVVRLLVVFPRLEPFLLTSQLDAYLRASQGVGPSLLYISIHALVFAIAAVLIFDRKDV